MAYTNAQPNDSASVPIAAPYSKENNTFPALQAEPGAYQDANSNQSSASVMSYLRPLIVQSTNNKSSGSVASLAKAFANNNIAGNTIIVCCGVGNGTAPTISDTLGNTYTQIAQVANGTAFNVAIFIGTGSAQGTGIAAGANTVTVNNGGSTASIAMEIYEVFGLLGVAVAQPDQKITNTGTSGTASTNAIGASFPNEIAFAAVGVGTAAQTITPATGWNNDSGQQNPTTPAGLFSFISMSQFLSSQVQVTPQATFTSEPWAIAVASFKSIVVPVAGTVETVTSASGGSIPFHALSAASNNATTVKSSPGQIYGITISNAVATARWFKLYDKASAPAPATDTVKQAYQILGNSVIALAFPEGMSFSTGISFAAVANMSDTDNTSIAANDLSMDIRYK